MTCVGELLLKLGRKRGAQLSGAPRSDDGENGMTIGCCSGLLSAGRAGPEMKRSRKNRIDKGREEVLITGSQGELSRGDEEVLNLQHDPRGQGQVTLTVGGQGELSREDEEVPNLQHDPEGQGQVMPIAGSQGELSREDEEVPNLQHDPRGQGQGREGDDCTQEQLGGGLKPDSDEPQVERLPRKKSRPDSGEKEQLCSGMKPEGEVVHQAPVERLPRKKVEA